ncbi:MAG: hypothetical protein QNI92_04755 [Desulfobacterales bacterium]|nr:hypothetical protein [Desulfobacterales bacterium]
MFYLKWLPKGMFLPVVWVMIVAFGAYLMVHGYLRWQAKDQKWAIPGWLTNPYFYIMSSIFILAMDFWAWEKVQPVVWGVPVWMLYFILLSGLQSIAMLFWLRKVDS